MFEESDSGVALHCGTRQAQDHGGVPRVPSLALPLHPVSLTIGANNRGKNSVGVHPRRKAPRKRLRGHVAAALGRNRIEQLTGRIKKQGSSSPFETQGDIDVFVNDGDERHRCKQL